jgi:cytochrome P450
MLGEYRALTQNPLLFLEQKGQSKADVIPIRIGLETLYLLNNADHVKSVFVGNDPNFVKGRYYRRITPLLGGGLFTLEGEEWRRQRHIAQPFFGGEHFRAFAPMIGQSGQQTIQIIKTHLADGAGGPGGEGRSDLDLLNFFSAIALMIAVHVFFGLKVRFDDSVQLAQDLSDILRFLEDRLWSPIPLPLWLPTKDNQHFNERNRHFHRFLDQQIDQRLAGEGDDQGALLLDAILAANGLTATDRAENPDARRKTTRAQLLSILIAAFETSALSMLWSLILLKQNPEIEAQMRAEADAVLNDEKLNTAHINQLEIAKRVYQESMRLYPPGWCFSRELEKPHEFGNTQLSAGKTVILCAYNIHRNPLYWEHPTRFYPDHFTSENSAKRPRHAYFPFAGGRHACLGARFAMLEGPYLLSLILKNFEIDIEEAEEIKPIAATTLRPDRPVRAHFVLRP